MGDCLRADGKELFDDKVRQCLFSYLAKRAVDELIKASTLAKKENRSRLKLVFELSKAASSSLAGHRQKLISETEIKHAQDLAKERELVIADLSHHIKNLVKSVIDPLQLCLEKGRNSSIEEAIKGADLIRSIVNAMNLTSSGSLEDFIHDARESGGADAVSIRTIVEESIRYSVANMFDKKYFSKFMLQYMPSREDFERIKPEWECASRSSDLEDILMFCKKNLFDISLRLDPEAFLIGDKRGSATKMRILFLETMLNAVKYSSFLPREKRKIVIDIASDEDSFALRVVNTYKPRTQVKSSGLGHIIIKNFCKLLQTEPLVKKTETEYSLEIKFTNLWRNHESAVR